MSQYNEKNIAQFEQFATAHFSNVRRVIMDRDEAQAKVRNLENSVKELREALRKANVAHNDVKNLKGQLADLQAVSLALLNDVSDGPEFDELEPETMDGKPYHAAIARNDGRRACQRLRAELEKGGAL